VADFDLDGLQDVLIGGGPVDSWAGNTQPGLVAFYKGGGTGSFQPSVYTTSGSVIDVEFADLDSDGTPDHLVVLTEIGSVGAFVQELLHLRIVNGTLTAVGYPHNLGVMRLTALEFADVIGDANMDYVFARTQSSGNTLSSQVYFVQGDGQGNVNNALWGTFCLPANTNSIGDFISSIQIADFNRDSHLDIAILRGFVQAPASYSMGPAIHIESDLLIGMGPNLSCTQIDRIQLPGYQSFSWTHNSYFAQQPLRAEPESIRLLDLGADAVPDLLIPAIRPITTSAGTTAIVTLKNSTLPGPGAARFEKVGAASGGAPDHPARIGFEGGRPRPGNGAFACTISNVRGGSLVGLMWGAYGQADMFTTHGFAMHMAPTEFGFSAVAVGALPGEGFHSYPLPIPNQLSLVGDVGYFQYCYYDPIADAFGGTQATGLWIGN
jgi:hypothetical protein